MNSLHEQYDDEDRCPYGNDGFKHCFRCHSKNEDVYWNSCANKDARDGFEHAMSKDD